MAQRPPYERAETDLPKSLPPAFDKSHEDDKKPLSDYGYHLSANSTALGSNNPYMSRSEHWNGILITIFGLCAVPIALWVVVIYVWFQPDHLLELTSPTFKDFADQNPTSVVAIYTLLSVLLAEIVAVSFGKAVAIYARYRAVKGRPITLGVLSALQLASTSSIGFSTIFSHWWLFVLGIWLAFTIVGPIGLNTILLPTPQVFTQQIITQEVDMSSSAFSNFYTSEMQYNCSQWTNVRGQRLNYCPASSAFSLAVAAGRSAFEFLEQGLTSYLRLGTMSFLGSTDGTFPFTSYDPATSSNYFTSYPDLPQAAYSNYTISFYLQALEANISCQESSTSPVSSNGVSCNTAAHLPALDPLPPSHLQAGWCADANGSYNFYMRYAGNYVSALPGETLFNENMTCSIVPAPGARDSAFHSFDNSTWWPTPMWYYGTYPSTLIEHILDNMADMMTIYAQNAKDNNVAEELQAINSAYFGGNYTQTPLITERFLQGAFAYLGSYERVLAEDASLNNSDIPRINATGVFQHVSLAMYVNAQAFALLIPITMGALVGLFLLWLGYTKEPLVRFDALDPVSLVIAASGGALDLQEAAKRGAPPFAKQAVHTSFSFAPHGDTWDFLMQTNLLSWQASLILFAEDVSMISVVFVQCIAFMSVEVPSKVPKICAAKEWVEPGKVS